MTSNISRTAFDAAMIPGMRDRLAEAYTRFRAAESTTARAMAPPEAGGTLGAYRLRDCPGCAALAVDALPVLSAHGLNLITCRACGLTYTHQVMDEADDAARYRESGLDAEAMRLRCSDPYLELESTRADYYLMQMQRAGASPGRLLDVGCGTGTLMVRAAAQGWRVLGLEPGAAPTVIARRQGVPVIEGYFPTDLPNDARPFDAIFALDVLEHFADPRRFLAQIRPYLAPNGHLFLQVPNWDSLLVQIEGARSSIVCPGHWSYFTPRTLSTMIEQEGYRTLTVETVVSELDRIMAYSPDLIRAAFRRIRPEASIPSTLTEADIYELQIGYKLIAILEPVNI